MKKKRLPLIIAAVALALFMALGACLSRLQPEPDYSSSPVTDTDDGYYSEERGE